MGKKLLGLLMKPVRLIVNTWRLGGWIAKVAAVGLVVSPICSYSTLYFSVRDDLSYAVPGFIYAVGHVNSVLLVPSLVIWHNGGRGFFGSMQTRLAELRPSWTRSSDSA